jgi:hypothetical protein
MNGYWLIVLSYWVGRYIALVLLFKIKSALKLMDRTVYDNIDRSFT